MSAIGVFGSLFWKADSVIKKTTEIAGRGMDKAAIYLAGDVIKSFGSPMVLPKGLLKRTYGGEWRRMKQREWREMQHSKPGDPPFVQTGMLRNSIGYDAPSPLTRRVGSSLRGEPHSYAFYLEMGTGKMAARPYLMPALRRCKAKILALVARG